MFKTLFGNLELRVQRLIYNLVWLLGTEVTARVARLLTILALALYLQPGEYGMVMLVLASHDILRLVLRCGAGAQIIQCSDRQLRDYCENGISVQWVICIALAIVQFCLAYVLGMLYDYPSLVTLLQAMAGVYLFYPITSVQVYLLQRDGRFDYFSVRNGACLVLENLSIPLFLWLGCGLWSIVLAKFAGVLLWTTLFINAPVARYKRAFEPRLVKAMMAKSGQLVATEVSRALRQHADLFIAGKMLLPELFGYYAFAKSAGIGISQSLSNAFNSALYPHLCSGYQSGRQSQSQTQKQMLQMTFAVAALFLLQAALAPFYVPIIFGNKWAPSVEAVSILCIAAIFILFLDTYCCHCRALGSLKHELKVRSSFSLLSILVFFAWQVQSVQDCAIAVLVGGMLWPSYYLLHMGIKRFAPAKYSKQSNSFNPSEENP